MLSLENFHFCGEKEIQSNLNRSKLNDVDFQHFWTRKNCQSGVKISELDLWDYVYETFESLRFSGF